VLYLLGRPDDAARYVGEALRGAPLSADIRVHAATVYLALGRADEARRELAKAIELDASVGGRPDVKALRDKLPAARR
jgi:Flp pilus assembly protein TadD